MYDPVQWGPVHLFFYAAVDLCIRPKFLLRKILIIHGQSAIP